jgi:hypothetical protein
MPRPEEEDIQLLLAVALAGGAISIRDDLDMRSHQRLEDLGWGELSRRGSALTFGLTEEGAVEADKILRRRKLR